MSDIEKQLPKIHKRDWDYLIVLDACRYDLFEKAYQNGEIDGVLSCIESPASRTEPWLHNFFRDKVDYSDVVVVSGCQYISIFRPQFKAIEDCLLHRYDVERMAMTAEGVNEGVIDYLALYPNSPMIVWYMQPHVPFIGKTQITYRELEPSNPDMFLTIEIMRNKFNVPEIEIENAYYDNLIYVLDHVKKLLPRLNGKVVITSDHGNGLGEKGIWGHETTQKYPFLRMVPWLEIMNESHGKVIPKSPSKRHEVPLKTFTHKGFDLHRLYGCKATNVLERHVLVDKVYEFFSYKPDGVYVDVGASIGLWSLLARYNAPESKIYAIEPDPYNFETILYNIKMNEAEDQIIPINIGLSNQTQTLHLNIKANDLASNVAPSGYKFQAMSWDDFIYTYEVEDVYLTKVDIEGHEMHFLNGMTRNYPTFLCLSNYHRRFYGSEGRDVLNQKLRDMGYVIAHCNAEITFAYRPEKIVESYILPIFRKYNSELPQTPRIIYSVPPKTPQKPKTSVKPPEVKPIIKPMYLLEGRIPLRMKDKIYGHFISGMIDNKIPMKKELDDPNLIKLVKEFPGRDLVVEINKHDKSCRGFYIRYYKNEVKKDE